MGWTRTRRKGAFRYFDGQGRQIRDAAKVGAMAEHIDKDELDRERVSAIALRLINLGWFRVGSERHARASRTYGITTLTRRHVDVRGHRVRLSFRGKHSIQVRSEIVDEELAGAMRELLKLPGGARVFRSDAPRGSAARKYTGGLPGLIRVPGGHRPVSRKANDHGFQAPAFAHRWRSGTRSRCRGAGAPQAASLMAYSPGARCRMISRGISATVSSMARRTILVCDNCGKEVDEASGAVMRITYADARRGAKQADLCGDCAGTMPGQPAARRGRRPKSASTAS